MMCNVLAGESFQAMSQTPKDLIWQVRAKLIDKVVHPMDLAE
jgi:hypothetical protein